MSDKHMVISKVERGFIVTFKNGATLKATAVYTDLHGEEFELDVKEFFRDRTPAELKKLEKRAKEPVV